MNRRALTGLTSALMVSGCLIAPQIATATKASGTLTCEVATFSGSDFKAGDRNWMVGEVYRGSTLLASKRVDFTTSAVGPVSIPLALEGTVTITLKASYRGWGYTYAPRTIAQKTLTCTNQAPPATVPPPVIPATPAPPATPPPAPAPVASPVADPAPVPVAPSGAPLPPVTAPGAPDVVRPAARATGRRVLRTVCRSWTTRPRNAVRQGATPRHGQVRVRLGLDGRYHGFRDSRIVVRMSDGTNRTTFRRGAFCGPSVFNTGGGFVG
ncbi:hypothetical protein [Miltoncostaea oceani]|uniref:hypothetical protein n=1 Tax=Miltoncostaea oceani TaxID=2843216 RepID=UPI001C3D05E8|nr:hypothetical protein [Miltoncostaea oceani]